MQKDRNMKYKKYRKGVTSIIYIKEKGKFYYLVVKRKLRWKGYGVVKGGILKSENYIYAVKRELREETGLKPIRIIDLKLKNKFDYPKKHQKVFKKKGFDSKCYAVQVAKKKIRLNHENSSYKFLSFEKAKKILTFKDEKELLEKADKKIRNII